MDGEIRIGFMGLRPADYNLLLTYVTDFTADLAGEFQLHSSDCWLENVHIENNQVKSMRTFEEFVMQAFAGEIEEGDSYSMSDTHYVIQDMADNGDITNIIELFKEAAVNWRKETITQTLNTL
jgi:hypothetical protein